MYPLLPSILNVWVNIAYCLLHVWPHADGVDFIEFSIVRLPLVLGGVVHQDAQLKGRSRTSQWMIEKSVETMTLPLFLPLERKAPLVFGVPWPPMEPITLGVSSINPMVEACSNFPKAIGLQVAKHSHCVNTRINVRDQKRYCAPLGTTHTLYRFDRIGICAHSYIMNEKRARSDAVRDLTSEQFSLV
jgi:hypothetical protein